MMVSTEGAFAHFGFEGDRILHDNYLSGLESGNDLPGFCITASQNHRTRLESVFILDENYRIAFIFQNG